MNRTRYQGGQREGSKEKQGKRGEWVGRRGLKLNWLVQTPVVPAMQRGFVYHQQEKCKSDKNTKQRHVIRSRLELETFSVLD